MSITKIQTVAVGAGGAASIDFTSIPGTYTDLMIVLSIRVANVTSAFAYLNINGSTANFTNIILRGDGTSILSGTGNPQPTVYLPGTNATAGVFGNSTIYIPNYAGSTNKSISGDYVTENNGTLAYNLIQAALWAQTAPITSIGIARGGFTFQEYSTATLYGVTKGSLAGVTVS